VSASNGETADVSLTLEAPVAAKRSEGRALHEARHYRRALRAYLRAGGTVREAARTVCVGRQEIERLLAGKVGLIPAAKARRLEALFSERAVAYVRAGVTFPIHPGEVPCALVAPLVREAFAARHQHGVELATGLPARSLFRVARETRRSRSELQIRSSSRPAARGCGRSHPTAAGIGPRALFSADVIRPGYEPKISSCRSHGSRHPPRRT
jgi:hypothetical protein